MLKNIAQFEKRHLTIPLRVNLSYIPQNLIENISFVWEKLGSFLTFIFSVITAAAAAFVWLLRKYEKRKHQKISEED
jgi:hypothetical protein